jgi:hypothetical protein
MKHFILFSIPALLLLILPEQARSSDYSASQMWGTDGSGVGVAGALESSSMHTQNGIIAGQVNAAKAGLLLETGGQLTIQAIGSQTVISSVINGNNNNVDIDADQTSTNTDSDVINDGTINSHY